MVNDDDVGVLLHPVPHQLHCQETVLVLLAGGSRNVLRRRQEEKVVLRLLYPVVSPKVAKYLGLFKNCLHAAHLRRDWDSLLTTNHSAARPDADGGRICRGIKTPRPSDA